MPCMEFFCTELAKFHDLGLQKLLYLDLKVKKKKIKYLAKTF